MTGFIYKSIQTKMTVAEKLANRRKEAGLTLEQINRQTGIPLKYLAALEDGDYDKLPGEIYKKLWLKKLAKCLGLDIQEIIKSSENENKLQLNFTDLNPRIKFKSRKKILFLNPKFARNLLIGAIIIILFSYLAWEIKKTVTPPLLKINEPQNYLTTTSNKIIISGQTESEASLWINNQLILASPAGDFKQEVELSPGLNTFQITAKRKNSQENRLTITVIKTDAPNNTQTLEKNSKIS